MPNYITFWLPFTVEELAVAFEAMGRDRNEALADARAMAQEMAEATEKTRNLVALR